MTSPYPQPNPAAPVGAYSAGQGGQPRIFVSHSFADSEFCRQFVAGLRYNGCDVWYDEHNLGPGGELRRVIESHIANRDYFIVILSPAAVASDWVNAEMDGAMQALREGRLRQIIPVVVAPCQIPTIVQDLKRIDAPRGQTLNVNEAVLRAVYAIRNPDAVMTALVGPSAQQMQRWKRTFLIVGGVITAFALMIASTAYYLNHYHSSAPYSSYTPPPEPITLFGSALRYTSPNDGWLLQSEGTLHYHNGQWQRQLFPKGVFGVNDFTMVSATEGWAVGRGGLILHYQNGAWTKIDSPLAGYAYSDLESVSMSSPDDGWAVGDINDGSLTTELLHYHAGAWSVVNPQFTFSSVLHAVKMISATEGWAVGEVNDPLILRYHNGAWKVAYWKDSFGPDLHGLAVVSSTNIWAVGGAKNDSTYGEIIMHYNGVTWSSYAPPGEGELDGVAMVSATEGWAVGLDTGAGSGATNGLILHYHNGAWQRVTAPAQATNFSAIQMFSASDGVLAGNGLWRLQNGTWQPIADPATPTAG